jgi:hypothetical protein
LSSPFDDRSDRLIRFGAVAHRQASTIVSHNRRAAADIECGARYVVAGATVRRNATYRRDRELSQVGPWQPPSCQSPPSFDEPPRHECIKMASCLAMDTNADLDTDITIIVEESSIEHPTNMEQSEKFVLGVFTHLMTQRTPKNLTLTTCCRVLTVDTALSSSAARATRT